MTNTMTHIHKIIAKSQRPKAKSQIKLQTLLVIAALALASCSGFTQQTAEKEAPCCASGHDHAAHASGQESFTIDEDGHAITTNHDDCNHEPRKTCDHKTDHVHGPDCDHDHATTKTSGHTH